MSAAREKIEQLAALFRQESVSCLMIGICGTGMRSIAQALIEAGHSIAGTDHSLATADALTTERVAWPRTPPRLYDDNADPGLTLSRSDLVISSIAIPDDDAWLVAARAADVPVFTLPQAVAAVWFGQQQICVAGTHGKTTTTALINAIATESGMEPGLYLGGQLSPRGESGRIGAGLLAVIESCEYRQSFLNLTPSIAVLTGIDRDHFDSFPNANDEHRAFSQFLEQCPGNANVVVNGDDDDARQCVVASGRNALTYGIRRSADFVAHSIHVNANGTTFDVEGPGMRLRRMHTALAGQHNVMNVLAAVTTASLLSVDEPTLLHAIGGFGGVRRRFEHRGQFRGATLIDDYAHHPTAIVATLSAARSRFPDRRLIAVFEPHQASRLQALNSGFRDALLLADECLVLPVLPIREELTRSGCLRRSGELVRVLNSRGGRAFLMANLDQATHRLEDAARDGDVIITMGAGKTDRIHDELNRKIQRDHAA